MSRNKRSARKHNPSLTRRDGWREPLSHRGGEPLEQRNLLTGEAVYISEVFFNPPNTDLFWEYIEIRGPANLVLDNYYFLEIENENLPNGDPGVVDKIIDLSGIQIGSNGYLVFHGPGAGGQNVYTPAPGSTALPLPYAPSNDHLEGSGATYAIIENVGGPGGIPVVGFDIDAEGAPGTDDGLDVKPTDDPENPRWGRQEWRHSDSVGVFAEEGEAESGFLYAYTNFSVEAVTAGHTEEFSETFVIDPDQWLEFPIELEYVGRWGDSTGTSVDDWNAINLTNSGWDSKADYRVSSLTHTNATPPEATHADTPVGTIITTNLGTVNFPGPLAVPNSSIVNRQLFYNNSAWDGNTLGVSTSDVLALATDKVAYLPGGGAMVNPGNAASPNSFKHVTSYSRGINGIFIDIQGPHAASLTAADFEFRINTGTNNSPSTWALAPNPSTITILPNTPAIGTDRIEIIWPNNSIRNNWLAVYVKANANTGLANNPGGKYGAGNGDLFFFGNRIGDAWVADAGSFSTGANDEVATHGSGGAGVAITNRFDFDRNKAVGVNDESIAHLSGGILSYINIGIPPLAPPPAPPADGGGDESGDAGISSALASSSAGGGSSASLPQWVADRLATADLNSGPMASFFQHLADKNTPESREILLAADNLADSLGLDDSLLDDLIAGLGL